MEQRVRDRLAEVLKEKKKSPPLYDGVPASRQPPWWIEKMSKLSHEELILRRLLD